MEHIDTFAPYDRRQLAAEQWQRCCCLKMTHCACQYSEARIGLPYVRRLLVAMAMPRMSRNRPVTVSCGTDCRRAAGFVPPLLACPRETSTWIHRDTSTFDVLHVEILCSLSCQSCTGNVMLQHELNLCISVWITAWSHMLGLQALERRHGLEAQSGACMPAARGPRRNETLLACPP